MAYSGSGRLPFEKASKIGHLSIIGEPRVQRLLEAFERVDEAPSQELGELSGTLDLGAIGRLRNVIAIDGSQAAIPNSLKGHKRLAFVTVSAVFLSSGEVEALKVIPFPDPRDLALAMKKNHFSHSALLPLSGVTIPGESVIESIRKTVDDVLRYTRLYDTLRFVVSREWDPEYIPEEHMECFKCGEEFLIPRSTLRFQCPHCSAWHSLADYLRIAQGPPEDWATEEAAISLRTVLETLLLLSFLKDYRDHPIVLARTLFLKDGPLLLRAQLSRLVEPIRAFFSHLESSGRHFHVLGVEKGGDLVDHVPQISQALTNVGDFFVPSVRYLHERIQGVPFVEATYRNRVQYGSKAVLRLGTNHVVVFNVPTGDFVSNPTADDLYGFNESMAMMSQMLSYKYENALIPIVLANSLASISESPSKDILESFARRLIG